MIIVTIYLCFGTRQSFAWYLNENCKQLPKKLKFHLFWRSFPFILKKFSIDFEKVSYLFLKSFPFILKKFLIYFENVSHLFWKSLPFILKKFPIYFEKVSHLFWKSFQFILKKFPIHFEKVSYLFWRSFPFKSHLWLRWLPRTPFLHRCHLEMKSRRFLFKFNLFKFYF